MIYAALGASDALGVGADDPSTEGWVTLLHGKLPPSTELVSLGVSGSTAAQALVQQVPQAEQLRPDLITVWLAVNDLRYDVPLEEYRGHLGDILGRLGTIPADTFVGNLPDLTALPEFQGLSRPALRREIEAWNSAIAAVVTRHGAHLVDLMEASEEIGEDLGILVADDGFHPSTPGHIALAEIFYHHINAGRIGTI